MDAYLLHLIESAAIAPAEFFIASLWQALLLAAAAWLGMEAWSAASRRFLPGHAPKIAPRTRFLLWMIVFVLAVLLPFSTLIHGHAVRTALVSPSAIPVSHLSAAWAVVILGAWGFASLFCLARLVINGWRLCSLARNATAFPSEALAPEILAQLSAADSRRIELRVSDRVDGPIAVGFFHPAIVIPQWLSTKLTAAELNQIVIHELAHLRRKDDWTNLLQKFLRALFPLNPALLWVERRLCREREMACDDAVLAGSISPREYATCLTALAEKRLLRNLQALAPGAWQRRSELVERVHRILKHKGSLSPVPSRPLIGTFLAASLCAGVALARCPRFVDFVPSGTVLPAVAASQMNALPPAAKDSFSGAHVVQAAFRTDKPLYQNRFPVAPHRLTHKRLSARSISTRTIGNQSINTRSVGARPAQPRLLKTRMAQNGDAANKTQIVFTVWEISPSFSQLPSLFDGDFSSQQLVTLAPHTGWIIFQL